MEEKVEPYKPAGVYAELEHSSLRHPEIAERLFECITDQLPRKTRGLVWHILTSIQRPSGEVIPYADYRRILGGLHRMMMSTSQKIRTIFDDAMIALADKCDEGTAGILQRMKEVVQLSPDEYPWRDRVHDLIKLLEIAYPFGINVTNPNFNGKDAVIPHDALVRLHYKRGDSASRIDVRPVNDSRTEDDTYVLQQEWRGVSGVYGINNDIDRKPYCTLLRDVDLTSIGKTRTHQGFFGLHMEDGVEVEPDFEVGDTSDIELTYFIARVRTGIIIMAKNIPVLGEEMMRRRRKNGKKSKVAQHEESSTDTLTKTAIERFKFTKQPLVTSEVFHRQTHGYPYSNNPDQKFGFYTIEQGKRQGKAGYGHVEVLSREEA